MRRLLLGMIIATAAFAAHAQPAQPSTELRLQQLAKVEANGAKLLVELQKMGQARPGTELSRFLTRAKELATDQTRARSWDAAKQASWQREAIQLLAEMNNLTAIAVAGVGASRLPGHQAAVTAAKSCLAECDDAAHNCYNGGGGLGCLGDHLVCRGGCAAPILALLISLF